MDVERQPRFRGDPRTRLNMALAQAPWLPNIDQNTMATCRLFRPLADGRAKETKDH